MFGVIVSVVEPVANVLWNSGTVWFPVTSVTLRVKVEVAGRFWAGVKVTDKPSFDIACVPTTLFAAWTKEIVPETIAED
jgi:hypothetical protein